MRYWICAVAFAVSAQVSAADIEAGRKKAQEVCAACHGPEGNSATADFPRLAGQYADYLAKALRDYKAGVRKNAIMGAMAQPLTAQDIENMAAYYAAQPGPLKSLY